MTGLGNKVSIFELKDLMCKNFPVNRITLKLNDNLKPFLYNNLDSQ
jgi:hypothetical protein